MVSLDCLGASGEVGRSAFMLHTDKKILLDYGVKIFDETGRPKFPTEDIRPDLAIITHAHLDHSGFVPALYKHSKIRWFATPPTEEICEILWKDSMKIMGKELPYQLDHFKRALSHWSPITNGQTQTFGKTKITPHDAGHIAGASMIAAEYEDKKIVYTGDFKTGDTQLHKGAKPIKDVDLLIMESTYANREHPDRNEAEQQINREIRETVEDGGTVLFPAFSLGRTQELIAMIRRYNQDVPIFLDGMGRTITNLYLKYGKYVRDIHFFKKAVSSVRFIEDMGDRKEAARTPGVIVTSAGMMMGGPILNYLFNVNNRSKVIFTGYNVEGTNGWTLLNKGFITKDEQQLTVDLPVEYMDLSAHAGRSELLGFIREANPEKIVLVHGDKPEEFAEELKAAGYNAVAPKLGDKIAI